MRPPFFPPQEPTADLQKTLDDFGTLKKLWLAYKGPCSEENCPICQSKSDGKQGKEDDKDDKDDEGNDEDNDKEEDEEEEDDDDDEDDDEYEDEDDDKYEDEDKQNNEEDEEGSKEISSSRTSRKRISKEQPDSTGQQSPSQDVDAKKSTHASKRRKKLKNTERDWMTSAPYDESIPYSHRYGYTWAGSTSNELMKLWQLYRKVEEWLVCLVYSYQKALMCKDITFPYLQIFSLAVSTRRWNTIWPLAHGGTCSTSHSFSCFH